MTNSDDMARWTDAFTAWAEQRSQLYADDARGRYVKWEYSDDDAVALLCEVAAILGIQVPEAEDYYDDEDED